MTKAIRNGVLTIAVMGIANVAAAATVTLAWDRSPQTTVAAYIIGVGTSSGSYPQLYNVGNVTTWTFNNLSDSQAYYFAVQALDVAGQRSPFSSEVVLGPNSSAIHDFGSDGTANSSGVPDLVWQHSTGLLALWYMDGAGRKTSDTYFNPGRVDDPNWRVVGVADMNRDRKPDLVWQHMTYGMVAIWLMDGKNLRQSIYVDSISDLGWRLGGVADMNGDRNPDLIWQHRSGILVVWFMSGTRIQSAARLSPSTVTGTWRMVAAGDVDLDGKSDLLWQNADGQLAVWFMNGITQIRSEYLNPGNISPTWKIVGFADFNQDGWHDIIWQRDDGYLAAWFMNGPDMVSSPLLTPSVISGGQWRIVGPR